MIRLNFELIWLKQDIYLFQFANAPQVKQVLYVCTIIYIQSTSTF